MTATHCFQKLVACRVFGKASKTVTCLIKRVLFVESLTDISVMRLQPFVLNAYISFWRKLKAKNMTRTLCGRPLELAMQSSGMLYPKAVKLEALPQL